MTEHDFRSLQNIPENSLRRLTQGLSEIAELADDARNIFPDVIVTALQQGVSFPLHTSDHLSVVDNVNAPENALVAFAFLASAITMDIDDEGDVETFVTELEKRELLNPEDRGITGDLLLAGFKKKTDLASGLMRTHIGNRFFPALDSLHHETEVRLNIGNDQVIEYSPIAMAHIRTDVADTELYFQMTLHQVRYMIRKLQIIESELATADKWAKHDDD